MMEELKESSYDPIVVCRASIGCLMSYRLKVDHQDVNVSVKDGDPDDADAANDADGHDHADDADDPDDTTWELLE